ncbi:MAG: OmpH family outer membrane protein [Candidatus Electryonea clarkiae]|nr:OmpH family outer membrane protein [Candidatus Electryonea clarkiae]MDP8287942.1 OmpH family outer membrane protein [Candidatus Electryonea clarkiae]
MKRIVLTVLALIFVASLTTAKDTKIGIIISQRIMEEYPEAQDAQKVLSDEIAEWQRQSQQMQDEIMEKEKEYMQMELMLSEEKKMEKQAELERDYTEFRQFQSGIEQKAFQRNQELFQPINEKIQKVIDEIAVEMSFDLILDAVGNNIAYADPTLDITDRVLDELKRQ